MHRSLSNLHKWESHFICACGHQQTMNHIHMVNMCPLTKFEGGQVFSIGTVAAYSAKYSALLAWKILELFQY